MLLFATGFSNVAEDSEIGIDFNPATSLSAHPRLTPQTFWDYEQPEASSVFGLFFSSRGGLGHPLESDFWSVGDLLAVALAKGKGK